MSPAVFLSRQMLVTWTSEKAYVLVHKHTENVLSPGVNLSTEENWDVNRVSHFRTSRQKKLFSLAGCFLHFFVIGVPDLLSNVLGFRETGLKHSSWIFFFPAPGDFLVPLLRPAGTVCLDSRCSNQSRRDIFPFGIHPHSFCSFCLTLTVV